MVAVAAFIRSPKRAQRLSIQRRSRGRFPQHDLKPLDAQSFRCLSGIRGVEYIVAMLL